ncbi:MAG: MBOAT family protein [Planctomycetes bacterium]|nr:MBOAT family protein [Planctomycetota bacterium]
MNFSSLTFFLFFALVCALHWTLRKHEARKIVLLAASYWFYGAWDERFLFLIIGSSAVDYVVGAAIARSDDAVRRKRLLITSLVVNLGALAIFKYLGFFVDSAVDGLTRLGFEASAPTLSIVLPVGISFYTFQTLSYTIDIYRGELRPARSAVDFFLFVAFFPQLVAGPIVRARDFLPQLEVQRTLKAEPFFLGLELFMLGLFKKLVIADSVGMLVDGVYGELGEHAAWEVLCAAIGFCFQIYADFSGYSDMAIGCAAMLGYRLPENFRLPYLSLSITDYWRRWHISLSSWFRDYLYIPLGGNRRGVAKTYRNLIATFLLTGLWHGANWTFVMFGAWNGGVLILERWWRALRRRLGHHPSPSPHVAWVPVCWVLATASTIISFIFFRADDLGHAIDIFRRIASGHPGYGQFPWRHFVYISIWMVAYHLACVLKLGTRLRARFDPWFLRSLIYTVYVLLMAAFAPFGERPFIYFQF